jgi:hypothetical protein
MQNGRELGQEGRERDDGAGRMPMSPRQSEVDARNYTWTPKEVLDWVMLLWLPGEWFCGCVLGMVPEVVVQADGPIESRQRRCQKTQNASSTYLL